MYTKKVEQKVEDRLLATHISNNANFEKACMTGDSNLIMEIVNAEMEKNNLHTKGSEKLKADIANFIRGRSKLPSYVGQNILFFVWNSRLSGTGHAVVHN